MKETINSFIKLGDKVIEQEEAIERLQERIDKAIEYIENTDEFDIEIFDCNTGGCLGTDLSIQAKTLLNILRGSDKE